MRARRKQKRVFQHQSRSSTPPESPSPEVFDTYKYEYDDNITYSHENISTDTRGSLRPQYF